MPERHEQAASEFPLWKDPEVRAELPGTYNAIEAGNSLAVALTSELGVPRWTWMRLRQLVATDLASPRHERPSIRCVAKLIEAFGPSTPMPPPNAFPALNMAAPGIDGTPPNRISVLLAAAMGRDARRLGWHSALQPTFYQSDHSVLADRSGPINMFAYVLKDLLLAANRETSLDMGESQRARLVPLAVMALFREATIKSVLRYLGYWERNLESARKGVVGNNTHEPLVLIDQQEFSGIGVISRPLACEKSIRREADEMKNCISTFWPMIASGKAVAFSLSSVRFPERATALLRPSVCDHAWDITCEGPANSEPSGPLRAAAHELRKILRNRVASQPIHIIERLHRAAIERYKWNPGSPVYTQFDCASQDEKDIVRHWFPCPDANPINALRRAWHIAAAIDRKKNREARRS